MPEQLGEMLACIYFSLCYIKYVITEWVQDSDCVEFEVLRGVTMKNAVFWEVMPCSVVENQSFRGTIHHHCEGSLWCSSNNN